MKYVHHPPENPYDYWVYRIESPLPSQKIFPWIFRIVIPIRVCSLILEYIPKK